MTDLRMRSVASALKRVVSRVDFAASLKLGLLADTGYLVTLLFHKLYSGLDEIDPRSGDPMEGTTLAMFEQLIGFLVKRRYEFVTPRQILGDGLTSLGRYALITFDDGYANNARALPVLEEFSIPALFNIATGNVNRGRSFWWDVLHREAAARGETDGNIAARKLRLLSSRTTAQIEDELATRFGVDAFEPRGESDRPFSPDELRALAQHPLVHLGNHTQSHAALSSYPLSDAIREIESCQTDLKNITGSAPLVIAYPNGAFGPEHLEAARDCGLKLGLGTTSKRDGLPIEARDR